MNKIIYKNSVAILIYSFFFYKLGNTLNRTNSEGIKCFSLLPLFTEGIIGPIKAVILLLYSGNIGSCFKFIWFELFRLSNPFSAFIFTFYIFKIIAENLY